MKYWLFALLAVVLFAAGIGAALIHRGGPVGEKLAAFWEGIVEMLRQLGNAVGGLISSLVESVRGLRGATPTPAQ